jgi:hypothetical protein
MLVLPVMAALPPLTVIVFVLEQPPAEYVIVGVPAATPVITPVDEPTVANAVLLLVHTPPDTACEKVVVEPTHTFVPPVIAASAVLTVTCVMLRQPALNV